MLLVLVGGIAGGLILLARGLADYRAGSRIGGISTSRIASIAVGEVLVSGAAEPIELTLVSPLQSAPCLYYRSRVTDTGEARARCSARNEPSDSASATRPAPSGSSRAGARFDVPDRYDERSGRWDGDPVGLQPRTGSAFGPGLDRESQVAALLTVRDPSRDPWSRPLPVGGSILFGGAERLAVGASNRHYTRGSDRGRRRRDGRRPGPAVLRAVRSAAANLLDASLVSTADPEVAADLAEARASGQLAATPAEAWGNAAIEGFGIGHPVRTPVLDPEADSPAAARTRRSPPAPATLSRSRPRPSSWPASRTRPCSSPLGAPAASRGPASRADPPRPRRRDHRDRVRDGPGGPPRRWRMTPMGMAAGFAVGLLVVVVLFFVVVDVQRRRRPPAPDRQGLGEHRGRAPAAPRSAPGARRRGPWADGVRARRPRPR